MLEAYRPTSLLIVLWPTQDFEFPEDTQAWGERLRAQFEIFTQQRVVRVPPGQALPPELPRLALVGADQRWIAEFAPVKLSLRLHDPRGFATLGPMFEAFSAQCSRLHSALAESHNLRVYRVGLVTQFFCETRSSANEKIAHYFLQPRALQGAPASEIQLGIHSRLTQRGGRMVNRWTRVTPLRSIDASHVDFAAQIEVDINTMAEDTGVKTGRDIAEFLDQTRVHMEEDMPLLGDAGFLA